MTETTNPQPDRFRAVFTVTVETKPGGDYYFDHSDFARHVGPWIEGALEDRDDIRDVTVVEAEPAEPAAVPSAPADRAALSVDATEKRARLFRFIEVGADESDFPSFAAALDEYATALVAIDTHVMEKADRECDEHIAAGREFRQLAERTQAWGQQHYDRANRYRARLEQQRLALSEALGLGTGAPWDAIRDRAAEVAANPPADRPAILREVADAQDRRASFDASNSRHVLATTRRVIATELRAEADEAPQPETQAAARETVEYFLQAQQDDGTWEDASSFMNAPDWAAERLAAKRAKHPDFPWRMAQRTTTVAVQPLPDCLACRHWRCNGDGPCGALVDAWQRCTCPGPAAVSQPGKEA